MLSRFTDFLTSDGEKPSRNRDTEFESVVSDRSELLIIWNNGWNCLFSALRDLQEEDLEKIVYIRNEGHTVTEAINRQLTHYAYHVGQIVYIGKMSADDNWQSLSIPKNDSLRYNAEKFSKNSKFKT